MRLCPWTDVVYGCDGAWWHLKQGLPQFTGTKLSNDTGACATYKDLHKVEVLDQNRILLERPGVIGSGGNSGFQAANLAVQFGVNRILLIGFDMHSGNGVHWYGRNVGRGMNNPGDRNYIRWKDGFNREAKTFPKLGVEVVNASMDSALVCFEKKSVEDTLAGWGV